MLSINQLTALFHSTEIAVSAFLNNSCTHGTTSAEKESIDFTATASSVGNTGGDNCVENTAEHLAVPTRGFHMRNVRKQQFY